MSKKSRGEFDHYQRIESFLLSVFEQEGYPRQSSELLAFYLCQLLWNLEPVRLVSEAVADGNGQTAQYDQEEFVTSIFGVFINHDNFSRAYRILMNVDVDFDELAGSVRRQDDT